MNSGLDELVSNAVKIALISIPGDWRAATFEIIFYDQGGHFVGENVSALDGQSRDVDLPFTFLDAMIAIREEFRATGQPVWGMAVMSLTAPDIFNINWIYDGCNANGDIPFDETIDLQRH